MKFPSLFRYHGSLPYSIAGLTSLLHTAAFSVRGSLLPYSNSPHSLSLTHQHLVLAITAASPALTLSPRYVNSITVSTPSHKFFSCSAPFPIFPSRILHEFFFESFAVTLFTFVHLPWSTYHCTKTTELAFTIKLQTPHGSTLLLDKPSFVILPLIITLNLPRLTFKPLLSKAYFYFENLFMTPLILSLIRTKSSAYINSLRAPSMANSLTTQHLPQLQKEKVTTQIF